MKPMQKVKNVIFTCNTRYILFISNSLKILGPECLATVVKIKSEGFKIKKKKNSKSVTYMLFIKLLQRS